ncbi:MAG: fibrobacter succinogenes major paralogous domain-containing protein [Fibrobacter sp.]|nr:fibrobacter succinogenes major paralogous domain-containing protein [Fibrobacter sp.]
MHKSWLALSFIAAMFLACGSDSSSGADSSEDITEVSNDKSSSSVSKDSASSDSKKSSSSSKKTNSSSSVKPESSASKGSSSSVKPESSASEGSNSSVKPESSASEGSSSSSVKPESSASEESSSSVEPESSSSEEPVSSSVEESSSSAEPEPRDASIYDAEANTLTDLRNSKVYRTTTIEIVDEERGIDYSEVWMAENLNYVTESSYCYGDEPEKCTTYGRLYTWAAAVGKSESECGFGQVCNLPAGEDIRGICPEGWHLPSDGEWNALIDAVPNNVAVKLRSTSGWNRAGTDDYSFSARATGFRNDDGTFANEDDGTAFWSSTEADSDRAYMMMVGDVYTYAFVTALSKLRGHTIRCLKD